jgi:hypothetical protein
MVGNVGVLHFAHKAGGKEWRFRHMAYTIMDHTGVFKVPCIFALGLAGLRADGGSLAVAEGSWQPAIGCGFGRRD